MAGHFRYLLSWRTVFMTLLLMACALIKKWKRLWNFVSTHLYSISLAATTFLIIVNVLVYNYGCKSLKPHIDPVKLHHGFIPVFPYHYFHGPDLNSLSNITITPSLTETPKLDLFLHSNVIHKSLTSDIPPIVHIVWCDNGPFTFTHYLSVLAAFKTVSPSVLNLHLIREPDLDPDGYFQFLPDLMRDLPPLVKKTLSLSDACTGNDKEKVVAFMKLLGVTGGFAINGKAILAPSSILITALKAHISISTLEDKTSDLVIMIAQANVLKEIPAVDALDSFHKSHDTKHFECQSVKTFKFLSHQLCVYINEDIYPIMIFNSSSEFDYLARWIAYGTSGKLISHPAETVNVPNIVHYVWMGKHNLDFFGYLSLLSSLYVLKAEVVYIHGDYKPKGLFWEEIEKDIRVKFIHRDFPSSVYGEPILKYAAHASDYLRGDVLLRYGGVYADWDVLFLRELPHSLRLHNTTIAVDWPETGSFPDVFNLGVMVAAPGAPYLRFFLESYRWYLDKHWSYNAIHMPYKVYEKQPSTLNINRHLQILCAKQKCHASWLKDYKQESVDHLESQRVNWQTDAIAIHWTYPDPIEFTSKEKLFSSNSVTAQIGQYVMRKANILT